MAYVKIDLSHSGYKSGSYRQWCPKCQAHKVTHAKEIEACPDCGGAVDPADLVDFGGLQIKYEDRKGGRFSLEFSSPDSPVIPSNDVRDALLFMLRKWPGTGRGELGPVEESILSKQPGPFEFIIKNIRRVMSRDVSMN